MEKAKKKPKLIHRLKDKYRLIIYNDSTIQTVWSIRLNQLTVFIYGGLGAIFLILVTTIIIAYTPLREYIPGYPNAEVRNRIISNYMLVDSLSREIQIRDEYFNKIKTLIEGDVPQDNAETLDTIRMISNVDFKEYNHDSVFMDKLLDEELGLSKGKGGAKAQSLANLHFFTPLRGMISNKYDSKTDHLGIDIVGPPNSRISAVLDGTVVFAGWTMDTGNCLIIQHGNNLVSQYKHNAELLKSMGDKVKAGEAIAIMGNSGEQSTGPHLHFELWHNGVALDPEMYIDF
jgi:murein DD-endopeptidase MepM/ murein hydrolase activator NlpD